MPSDSGLSAKARYWIGLVGSDWTSITDMAVKFRSHRVAFPQRNTLRNYLNAGVEAGLLQRTIEGRVMRSRFLYRQSD